ncbi:aldose epimerase family protein [Metabacillus rhizolycopersici]|uniref:Aldose 1-epimerase n=1 Tax=Metabacillus rhizolycopersici TaxID=2875709 RepID=A0ABS7UWX1_9BACI|nr:aldose epimerase family protein [Metabacillus rhizolycopersici]MBZ5752820.1 galactose mutarotase [Metabacillus rhizolycopersici]
MKLTQSPFGDEVLLFTIENDNGVILEVSNYGARIVNLFVPTDSGRENIVLGFDSIEDYKKETYYGATIGRVAGRIKNGEFSLDESLYKTSVNQSGNTLHGGNLGFDEKIWDYEVNETDQSASIIFSTNSPDGENGFPGNLEVSVTYTLDNLNIWSVGYQAKSDKDTIFNPTNHVYFNLTGHPSNPIDDHSLQIFSEEFAPVNADTTVTGEKRSVIGTPYDFRTQKKLKSTFESSDAEVKKVRGIDHPFFLTCSSLYQIAAKLISPDEKIKVEVYTENPTIVVYTANNVEGVPLMHGEKLIQHGGITFETQVAPGAIEFENFGDIILLADEIYASQTKYKISYLFNKQAL